MYIAINIIIIDNQKVINIYIYLCTLCVGVVYVYVYYCSTIQTRVLSLFNISSLGPFKTKIIVLYIGNTTENQNLLLTRIRF